MKFNTTKDKASYRIDFNFQGKRKRLYPGTTDEVVAKQLAKQMTYEWETGQFDLTLASYKLKNKQQPKVEKSLIKSTKTNPETLLELWDRWVESLYLEESIKNGHYYSIRQVIKKYNPKANDPKWYADLRKVWAISTWTNRKSYITSCINWSIEEELL